MAPAAMAPTAVAPAMALATQPPLPSEGAGDPLYVTHTVSKVLGSGADGGVCRDFAAAQEPRVRTLVYEVYGRLRGRRSLGFAKFTQLTNFARRLLRALRCSLGLRGWRSLRAFTK